MMIILTQISPRKWKKRIDIYNEIYNEGKCYYYLLRGVSPLNCSLMTLIS